MAATRQRLPWQRHPATQLAAVALGVLPMYAVSAISGYRSLASGIFQVPGVLDSILNAAFVVLFFGSILLALLYILCGERLSGLQLQQGSWTVDLVRGLGLAGLLLGAQVAFNFIVSLFISAEVPLANREIASALSGDALLLAVWLGPVVWLQAALIEEFSRVFLLTRLWQVWPAPAHKMYAVIASALLFGLGHIYQGPLGILGTALIGLLLAWHFLRYGRVLPLFIAHGVYNTVVLAMLVSWSGAA
ncbi:CPBP family intramembrane metalloprotease [bacterium]|nr:CPBP family intramembrane metalloprotease [bacterium]